MKTSQDANVDRAACHLPPVHVPLTWGNAPYLWAAPCSARALWASC
jgi:hypothetical protein